MSLKTKTACPYYAPDAVKASWDSWTETQRTTWRNQNPSARKEYTVVEGVPLPEEGTFAKTESGKIVPILVEKHVTEWDRDMELDGKIIPAKRIRYAILELISKNKWYAENISNGFVERLLGKVLADSTPGWEPPEADPLFGTRKYKNDDEELDIAYVRRAPRTEEERVKIRNRFGVTDKTAKFLAKKDCPLCKGVGEYKTSAYPGDPLYQMLPETVECSCSFE